MEPAHPFWMDGKVDISLIDYREVASGNVARNEIFSERIWWLCNGTFLLYLV